MNKKMGFFSVLSVTLLCNIFLVICTPQDVKTYVFKKPDNELSDDPEVTEWWQTAAIYEIFPRSFKDSDNDGNGDLQGIIQKLDYFKDLKIDAIWLTPIFKSPQIDIGYDVADYRDIDSLLGSLDDLRQLLDEAHKLNIKLLLDYVPNHTSDQHAWFQASLKRDPTYDEYYIWRNATYVDGERNPPNNWISCYSGSPWEWNEERQQYYFHQFSTAQPDLNYRNPAVVEEMKDVLRYWLDFGVDGFRMDAVGTLFEDVLLRDEPESGTPGLSPNDHGFLNHVYTIDQPESFDMIYQWRDVLDEFNQRNNSYTRIMITEGNSNPNTVDLFYGSRDGSRKGAHFTFNFITFLTGLQKNFTSLNLFVSVFTWMTTISWVYTSNWLLGNHDHSRVSTRLGVENIDALNMLASLLAGAQITYQGEEIGQENGEVTCEEGFDLPIKNCSTFNSTSRDFERTPFQWDNSTNAGFNDGAKPWLPVSEKYLTTNLAQQNVPETNTHFNIYKEMLNLRQDLKNSSFNVQSIGYSLRLNIFYTTRMIQTSDDTYAIYVFYYNIGDSETVINDDWIYENCTVSVRNIYSDYKLGDEFISTQPLNPYEALICLKEVTLQ